MYSEGDDPLSSGLLYTGSLPLRWSKRAAVTGEAELQLAMARAEQILQALLLLQDQGREVVDDEGERAADIIRLEAKVDLLLDLVSQLLQTDTAAGTCSLRLGATAVAWQSGDAAVEAGMPVWIELFLDRRLPAPLRLPGVILAAATANPGWITAQFECCIAPVVDLLEKVIFRQHRRQVAQMKAAGRP